MSARTLAGCSKCGAACGPCSCSLLPLASWNDYEPLRRCSVNVVRISDGRVLVSYDYKLESAAIRHQLSLIGRMREMSVGEFDRDLGIGSISGNW